MDTRLDWTVAVKVLSSRMMERSESRKRFEREARVVASLNHPHISALYDVGQHDGRDYLVIKFVHGQTLAARLTRGALPLDQALRYASETASALIEAHRAGVVHRDLKPANIMLTDRAWCMRGGSPTSSSWAMQQARRSLQSRLSERSWPPLQTHWPLSPMSMCIQGSQV